MIGCIYFSLNLALTCAMLSNYLWLNGETGLVHDTSLNQKVRQFLLYFSLSKQDDGQRVVRLKILIFES